MVVLTNPNTQTLAAGESLVFTAKSSYDNRGGCCCSKNGTYARLTKGGPYLISFSGNIGTTEADGIAELEVSVGGEVLPEMGMVSETSAAGGLNTVSRSTVYYNCCREVSHVVVKNSGGTAMNIGVNPTLIIKEV